MAAFINRLAAGDLLARRLAGFRAQQPIVLGLPRGGVPVAYQVARTLHAPLDVCISRKIGVPWQPELGVGAVAEGGVVCLDHHTLQNLGLTVEDLADVIQREQAEVALRVERFRGGRARPALQARTVIVVDDGIAMGGTMRAAIASLRRERPRAIVAAVPVAAADAADALQEEVDQLVSLVTPRNLSAIGAWYEDFKQVSDAEVVGFLDSARRAQHPGQEVSHETVH